MFSQKDLVHLGNLKKMLAKAQMNLEGLEILAAADVLRWVEKLEEPIKIAMAQAQELQETKQNLAKAASDYHNAYNMNNLQAERIKELEELLAKEIKPKRKK